ncbi:MAG TPA: polysaccharide deacetylase family protein [Burkholderiales bacterium]
MAKRYEGDCILMYHGTPRGDAARLAGQLRALACFFDVVPLEALAVPGRGPRGRRRAALTFDDGLRSNVAVAYPILESLGLHATFFVCPGIIDSGAWLWNHEARQRLRALPRPALAELAAALGAPAEAEAFVEWMKTLPLAARRRAEEAVRAATPAFRPSAAEREAFDVAGWDELKRLDPRVVSIGSHSLTHPILTSLDADALEAEVGASRARLESELGRPVAGFCYPNGDLNGAALAAARRHYRLAVGVGGGSLRGDVDVHRLPRFAAHPSYSLRLARALALA